MGWAFGYIGRLPARAVPVNGMGRLGDRGGNPRRVSVGREGLRTIKAAGKVAKVQALTPDGPARIAPRHCEPARRNHNISIPTRSAYAHR